MALSPGTRIGSFEIAARLGAGGMGEVYRATDTKLGRDVAVKVVSQAFTYDPERAARFEREAQLLAALNHPHIAAIYGLEQADGSQFLVMELVEGETLAEKLAGGALPVDEALRVAGQIADALSAAHDKGIIHRDLKPANIALTAEGQVKVLDFGLAKAIEGGPAIGDRGSAERADSPTLTLAATQAGVILGTAAYMAPEQAKGKAADKRSDLWSFGCVLYEMLTGRRTFDGDDASDTMAAVLRAEPDWNALPAGMPPAIRLLLRRCLEKDRRARSVDAGAALFVLRELSAPAAPSVQPATPAQSSWRRTAAYTVAALILMAGAALAAWLVLRPEAPRVTRFIASAGQVPLSISGLNRDLAISPDGTRIVYRAGNLPLLHVREMDRLEGAPLAGTENSVEPFFSPDGRWIAFWQGGFLRKVSVQGGPPANIASGIGQLLGGTWGRDDTIVYSSPAAVLFRVPAAGGTPMQIPLGASDSARGHRWPRFLPNGRHLLVTRGQGVDQYTVIVLDLETQEVRELFAGSDARYVSTGHVVFSVGGALQAARFDAGSLEASADRTPVVEQVLTKTSGAANFDVSGNGSLVYVAGSGALGSQVVVTLDRQGRVTPLAGIPTGSYRDVRVSPDGRRVAVATFDDVWTYDIARRTMSRLTTNPAQDRSPLWTRDGQRILFTSMRANYPELFSKPADGTGTDERLFTRAKDAVDLRANGWSADGRRLLFTEVPANIYCAIGHAAADKLSEQAMLVQNDFCNDYSAVSPDGRWIAYDSVLAGRYEIYVERYPEMGGRQQISTNGGRLPLWSPSGRELYFASLDTRQILAVPIQPGPPLTAGGSQVIFEGEFLAPQTGWRPYDIGPDGRFVIIRSGGDESRDASAPDMVVVQHWAEELKRLVPAK